MNKATLIELGLHDLRFDECYNSDHRKEKIWGYARLVIVPTGTKKGELPWRRAEVKINVECASVSECCAAIEEQARAFIGAYNGMPYLRDAVGGA